MGWIEKERKLLKRAQGNMRALVLGALLWSALTILLAGCGERLETVRDYRRAGIEAMQEGNYREAAESFRHAMDYYGTAKQDKTETDILRYLGEAEFRSGRYEEAVACYKQLLKSDSRRAEYLDMLAVCTVKTGDAETDAIALYQEASDILRKKQAGLPDFHLDALYSLGESLLQSSDSNERSLALRYYREAAEVDADNPELMARIGKLLVASGDTDSAAEYFSRGRSVLEQRLSEKGLSEEERSRLDAQRRELLMNEAVRREYAGEYREALEQMEAIAAEYGSDDPALTHEIAFLKSRVEILQSEGE